MDKTKGREGAGMTEESRAGAGLTGLDRQAVSGLLRTRAFGRNIEVHETIGSTNTRARDLAMAGIPHGTVVIADEQREGRGRRGRSWVSPKGAGIWMSVVLRPGFKVAWASRITVIAALSVSEAVYEATGSRPMIKWPNDLIMGNKKVCGILTEIRACDADTDFVIAGIGLNVNTHTDQFPSDLARSATSIYQETGIHIDRNRLIADILNSFETLYENLARPDGFAQFRMRYRDLCITLGRRVRVCSANEEFEGTAMDITGECTLLVKLDDGTVREILSGDVSVRGIAGYI